MGMDGQCPDPWGLGDGCALLFWCSVSRSHQITGEQCYNSIILQCYPVLSCGLQNFNIYYNNVRPLICIVQADRGTLSSPFDFHY